MADTSLLTDFLRRVQMNEQTPTCRSRAAVSLPYPHLGFVIAIVSPSFHLRSIATPSQPRAPRQRWENVKAHLTFRQMACLCAVPTAIRLLLRLRGADSQARSGSIGVIYGCDAPIVRETRVSLPVHHSWLFTCTQPRSDDQQLWLAVTLTT
jgi:hypothetical protein